MTQDNNNQENTNSAISEKQTKPSKARGLGRGLDALFADDEAPTPPFSTDNSLEGYQHNEPDSLNNNKANEDSLNSPHTEQHSPSFNEDQISVSRETDTLTNHEKTPNSKPVTSGKTITRLNISEIEPCQTQPRRHFDSDALEELASSLKRHGMIAPIVVRPHQEKDGIYEIIAGERRWRASQLIELHDVPVIILQADDKRTFELSIIENLQRENLNPVEEAMGYYRLIEEHGHLPGEIGKIIGKSRSYVANMTRILALPEPVLQHVIAGKLTTGHARALLASDQPELIAHTVINEEMSVRATEKLIKQQQDNKDHSSSNNPVDTDHLKKYENKNISQKDADILALQKELSDQLGMTVSINMKNEQKGSLTIDYSVLDQLDNLIHRLMKA